MIFAVPNMQTHFNAPYSEIPYFPEHNYCNKYILLHIMSGYQFDKPVKWYDIISLHGFELSNQIDCNNLVGPIGLHVLFQI